MHQGTTAATLITNLAHSIEGNRDHFIRITSAANNSDLFELLEDRKIDAVIYDFDRTYSEVSKHPEWVAVRLDYDDFRKHGIEISPEEYGISFWPMNYKLCDDVNDMLAGSSETIQNLMDSRIKLLQKR